MGRRGSAAVAGSHRTRGHVTNQPQTLPRTEENHCLKQQNEGSSEKTRPTAAEQTENRKQKKAVAIVVGMKKEGETKQQYIPVKY
jgi:hypothetical protein